jgi:flagellar basal-body rod protein FlgB
MSVIDKAFSIHDDALMLRSRRSSILAANIANADTPDYKARDMDFSSMMTKLQSNGKDSFVMARTSERHMAASVASLDADVKYRNPLQPALDGNTVDMYAEQARFSQNALQYQTSMTMLNSKIRGLMLAIKGQ